jgi:hypothetical protein
MQGEVEALNHMVSSLANQFDEFKAASRRLREQLAEARILAESREDQALSSSLEVASDHAAALDGLLARFHREGECPVDAPQPATPRSSNPVLA